MRQGKNIDDPASTTGENFPLYVRIRDEIIRRIQDGTYPPGSSLPSNAKIQERWGVSHKTSRRVLQELVNVGWAKRDSTRGYIALIGPPLILSYLDHQPSRIKPHQAPQQAPPPAYPQAAQPQAGHHGLFPQAAPPYPPPPYTGPRPMHTIPLHGGIPPELVTVANVQVTYEPAPPDVAAALKLQGPGTPVRVRRSILTDPTGTTPVELRTSYLAASVPDTSPLVRPEPLPGPWIAELARHSGQIPATADIHINARLPHEHEATALRLPMPTYVLVRATTTHSPTSEPLDHTISVWPATVTAITATGHPLT